MNMDTLISLLIQSIIVLLLGKTDSDGYQIYMKLVVPNQSYNGAYPTSGTALFRSTRLDSMMCYGDCSLTGSGRSVFYDTVTSKCSCFEERYEDFPSFEIANDTIYLGILRACPPGWLFYGFSCYYIDTQQTRNKDNSKTVCETMSSHMVRIDSADENDFLFEAVSKIASSGSYLIGLFSPLSNGQFVWEDTMMPPIFTDWDWDQPDLQGEHCTAILYTHGYPKWHDVFCSSNSYSVICELDPAN